MQDSGPPETGLDFKDSSQAITSGISKTNIEAGQQLLHRYAVPSAYIHPLPFSQPVNQLPEASSTTLTFIVQQASLALRGTWGW